MTCTELKSYEAENAAAALIVVITSISGIIGNGLVILSYYLTTYLKSQPSNLLIVNLALTDFLSCVYIQMPCIINLYDPAWHLSKEACVVHSIIMWGIMTASKWTLAAISLDRAIALNNPFKYRSIVTKLRVRCTVLLIWLFSFTTSGTLIKKQLVSYQNWELLCSPRWTKENEAKAFTAGFLCFWLPSVILVISNFIIIHAVRTIHSRSPNQNSSEENQPNSRNDIKNQNKTLRSFYVLVAVYFICGSPYFLGKFSFVFSPTGWLTPSLMVFCMLLMFISSSVNPFIYSFLRKEHRKALDMTIKILSSKRKEIWTAVIMKLKNMATCCKKIDKDENVNHITENVEKF